MQSANGIFGRQLRPIALRHQPRMDNTLSLHTACVTIHKLLPCRALLQLRVVELKNRFHIITFMYSHLLLYPHSLVAVCNKTSYIAPPTLHSYAICHSHIPLHTCVFPSVKQASLSTSLSHSSHVSQLLCRSASLETRSRRH